MAADNTSDSRPSVKAFHVFNAITAMATGTNTVALNFKPKRNGMTILRTKPRPEKKKKWYRRVKNRQMAIGVNVKKREIRRKKRHDE